MLPNGKFKGRISKDAIIIHDHCVFAWPYCKPPLGEYQDKPYAQEATDPNMIFDMVLAYENHYVRCTAPGYGDPAYYGNGSILVFPKAVTPC